MQTVNYLGRGQSDLLKKAYFCESSFVDAQSIMVAGSIFMNIIEMNVQILLAEPVSLINQKIFIRLY